MLRIVLTSSGIFSSQIKAMDDGISVIPLKTREMQKSISSLQFVVYDNAGAMVDAGEVIVNTDTGRLSLSHLDLKYIKSQVPQG